MKRMWDEQELIAIAKQVLGYFGFKPLIVESLPETGEPNVLYLVPKEDSELGDIYEEFLWLNSAYESVGTTGVDLSDYVDLASNQTITGSKTFSAQTRFTNKIFIEALQADNIWSSFGIKLGNDNLDVYQFGLAAFKPYQNNTRDLGQSDQKWKDIYLAGSLKDGSNSVTVADLAALITYAKAQGWIS